MLPTTVLQLLLPGLLALRTAVAFTLSNYVATCGQINFTLALSEAEINAADTYCIFLHTPKPETRWNLFDFTGPDPNSPLFTSNQLVRDLTINWDTPLISGGSSAWESALVRNESIITLPGSPDADWLSFTWPVFCGPSANATPIRHGPPATPTSGETTATLPAFTRNPAAMTTQYVHMHDHGSETGAIVGGIVGGLAVLAISAVAIAWLLRRRSARAAESGLEGARGKGPHEHSGLISPVYGLPTGPGATGTWQSGQGNFVNEAAFRAMTAPGGGVDGPPAYEVGDDPSPAEAQTGAAPAIVKKPGGHIHLHHHHRKPIPVDSASTAGASGSGSGSQMQAGPSLAAPDGWRASETAKSPVGTSPPTAGDI
ncbi:hypothetical protein OC835_004561 [Tilletia horrida]|nr:hypothetical protein OC835_004561 [Tilletia horrida]